MSLKEFVMRKINKRTGEIIPIKVEGLWSHFPIPAYRLLAEKGEWNAQQVLLCLVSYLGGENGFYVWPTYSQIHERSGVSRKRIREALNVLENLGLVQVFANRTGTRGKWANNKYLIKMSCWDVSKMNELALEWIPKTHKCLDCGALLSEGQFGDDGGSYKPHWGCGGQVRARKSRKKIA
jgi:hypothetical protein